MKISDSCHFMLPLWQAIKQHLKIISAMINSFKNDIISCIKKLMHNKVSEKKYIASEKNNILKKKAHIPFSKHNVKEKV